MKTKLILLVALTTLSMMAVAQTKDTVRIQKAQNYMYKWEVKIRLDLQALNPEEIQIGMLKFDPAEKFMQNFNMSYLAGLLKMAKNDTEKTVQINSGIKVEWNNLFADVRRSELYLLKKDVFVLSTLADYTKPKTKIWLVSKMFYLNDKPYCYIIPMELENGSKLEFTLNTTNLTSLTDLYNKIRKINFPDPGIGEGTNSTLGRISNPYPDNKTKTLKIG
jgi:hypothetical protein